MYSELIKQLRHPWEVNGLISELTNSAADAIEELSKPRWIPVTERLPENEGRYLAIFYEEMIIDFGYYRPSVGWCEQGITHWMPLPEPPKEER